MRRLAAVAFALAVALAASGCVYEPKGSCGSSADCAAGESCSAGVCVAGTRVTAAAADPSGFATVAWAAHLGAAGTTFRVDGIGADLAGNVVVGGVVDEPFDFGPGVATSGAFAVQLAAAGGAPAWATFFPALGHGRFAIAVRPDTGETFFAGAAFEATTIGTTLVPASASGTLVVGKLGALGEPLWVVSSPNIAATAPLAPVSLAVRGGDLVVAGTGGVHLDPGCDSTALAGGAATFVASLDADTGLCRWVRGLLTKAITGAAPASSGPVIVAGLCQPVGASFDPGDASTCARGLYVAALDGASGDTLWSRHSLGAGTVTAVRDVAVAGDARATVVGDATGSVDLGGGAVDFGAVSARSFAATFSPSGAFTTLVRPVESPDAASPDVASLSRAAYDGSGGLWLAGRYEGQPALGGVRFTACRAPACGAASFVARVDAGGAVAASGGFVPLRAAPDAGGASYADDLVLCATTGTVAHALRLTGDGSVGTLPAWTGAAGDLAAVRVSP